MIQQPQSSPSAPPTATEVLARTFGYSQFRPGQQAVIEAVLNRQDALAIMPTGAGKSICYQIPALMMQGLTLVVSPLIALMQDQVEQLRANGVEAAYLNSSLSREAQHQVFAQLRAGALKLLYVSPERLLQSYFLEQLSQLQLALFAIDEAHCISQWGHDFRPEYAALGTLKQRFSQVPVVALTATADRATQADIAHQLNLQQPFTYVGSFDRPNIRYTQLEKFQPQRQLVEYLKERRGQSGIVYCSSRKRVEMIAERLRQQGFDADFYHAGLDSNQRSEVQQRFIRDELAIVVATVAFGMGINKPNVRFVVHFDIPKNIESYYQETGRAGRDGLPAEAVLLYDPADIARVRVLIEQNQDAHERQQQIESQKLNAMAAFSEAQTCRRQVLLHYFGESRQQSCGNCDICIDPPKQYDGSRDAQIAMSCIYRMGQRFGINYVVEVLRGADTQRVRDFGHHKLSTWGLGKEQPSEHWLSVIRQLIHLGLVIQDFTQHGILCLTEQARAVLRGDQPLQLAVPRLRLKGHNGGRVELSAEDRQLFARLRHLRKQLADAQDVPPYVVFSDATLLEMAQRRPTSDKELLQVNGIGATKLARYGEAFLTEVCNYILKK